MKGEKTMFDHGNLRYHEACHKASHNSYEREEIPVTRQLDWNANATHDACCRGLELDLQQSPSNWEWSVAHIGGYNGAADVQFSAYLDLFAAWSELNRGHDPITVMLDLKATSFDDKEFSRYLDAYIERHLPREKIFTPGELLGNETSLMRAVLANGWPLLNDLRGKFIFCLSGNEQRKRKYASLRKKTCLCFSDHALGPSDDPPRTDRGNRVFFNFKLSDSYFMDDGYDGVSEEKADTSLHKLLGWFREHPQLITRGYDLNTGRGWKRARELGVNVMSTDKVRRHRWATVGDKPFMKARKARSRAGVG
jgi:hypothetical protein